MRYCNNCGSELGNSKFCTKCGAKAPEEPTMPAANTQPQKRFCTNCGADLGNERFCVKCGTKADDNFIPQRSGAQFDFARRIGGGKGPIMAVMAIVLVCAIGVTCFFACSGRSYKTVIKQMFDATLSGDVKKIISLVPEEQMRYEYSDWDTNKKARIEEIQKQVKSTSDSLKSIIGEGSKLDYKITNDRDYTGSELSDIKDEYKKKYNLNVAAAKELTVQIKVKILGVEKTQDSKIKVVKIGRSWYLSDLGF